MFGPLLDRLAAIIGIRRVHVYELNRAERNGTVQTKGETARIKALSQTLTALEKDPK